MAFASHSHCFVRSAFFAAAAVLVCGVGTVGAASAVLSGINLVGGPRGVAITLQADAPFSMTAEAKAPANKSHHALVAVHCSNAIYGLEDFAFTTLPPACPVRQITVKESPAGNSIDLLLTIVGTPAKPMPAKQAGSRWIILLSRSPSPVFTWSAPVQTAAPAAVRKPGFPKQPGLSRLTDISVRVRDKVELITFGFDGPTTMRFKRDRDRMIVLFVNATSGLPQTRLSPQNDSSIVIELKQVAHGGTLWLGASVSSRGPSLKGAIMQAFPDKLVIYAVRDSLQGLSFWSAATGRTESYDFVKLPRFTVDIESLKKKAVSDLSGDLPEAKTFAIREEPPHGAGAISPVPASSAETSSGTVTKAPQPPFRLMVTRDNVNLRSEPAAGNNITARLQAGTVGTEIEKKREWTRIQTDTSTGWVSVSMVVDSSRAPRALLESIAKANNKRLAREKAAEEKVARDEATKEKREQEKIAQDNLVKDREAKKKAAAAALAASRDSSLHRVAVADSIQTANSITARKPVAYHEYGRDPFLPLSNDETGPVPNVENLRLVGILYDQTDRIALFEAPNGSGHEKAFALRENDPVQNGYVLRIQPDKVLFLLNELGISRTYALKLTKENE